MGEVVVAVMNRSAEVETLLDAAARLLEIGGGGTLKALAIRTPPETTIMPTEEVLTAARAGTIRTEQHDWAAQVKGNVEAWAARTQPPGVETVCADVEGDTAAVVTEHGRRADAIVLGRPLDHDTPRAHDALHAALFATSCPVLVVPAGFARPFGRIAAIAWKNDEHAAKAVRASLPILRQAEQVHVLRAGDGAEIPPILTEHGIAAEIHTVPDGPGPTGERILAAAKRLGADMLIMGAFAHSAWTERLFGGVTRTIFADADLPVLMQH
jgi:nucleotide-binding universal stress UspA family protein